MRPGVVMISNFVTGSKKNYSGIIDYYERYDKRNGNTLSHIDTLKRMESAIEDDRILLSKKEKKLIEEYDEYLKSGGTQDLIDYIKENDKQNDVVYGNYINYMNKDVKASGLFGDNSDYFSFDEKIAMKDAFNKGQDNGSVLWGNVYSFDNEFLKKHNLLDDKTGYVNEIKIKQAVRESIRVMMKEEGLDQSAVWCGEIHYDTDNIHVHTSVVEMKNTRPFVQIEKMKKISSKEYERTGEYELQPKAKLKKKTLDKMKSTLANNLIDRTQDLQLISDRRFNLHHSITIDKDDLKQKRLLESIRESLPENKKDWQYNNRKLDNVRPFIDEYTVYHLNKFHYEDYNEYKELLNKEEEYYREVYGEGKDDRYKDYAENKMNELKAKTGNELLKEMKQSEKSISYKKNKSNGINSHDKYSSRTKLISRESYKQKYNHPKSESRIKFQKPIHLHKINHAVKTTLRSEKRDRELEYQHHQLQQNIEHERGRQEYGR